MPPTYEETLADKLKEGKQIYVDPRYLPELEDLPPEYDENEVPDYALDNEDEINLTLDYITILTVSLIISLLIRF